MRTCPYCAEDIADEAARCPHCGSDLTTGLPASRAPTQPFTVGAPAPAPAPAAAGPATAVQFSHTGQRFLLGYDATHFGIWDRTSPAAPVEQFPRSDDGWSQAWRRYASLEPANQPVGAVAPAAAPGPYGGPPPATTPWAGQPPYQQGYAPVQTRRQNGMAVASLVLGLVGLATFFLFAVPNILAVVFGFLGRSQIRASGGAQEGDGMAIAGIVLGIVGMAIFVIFIIASVNDSNF